MVHGNKDSIQRLIDAITDERAVDMSFYYLNEEKPPKCFRALGIQYPAVFRNLDGLTHIILEPTSPVKMRLADATQSQQFKRWVGDWQNTPPRMPVSIIIYRKALWYKHFYKMKKVDSFNTNGIKTTNLIWWS